MFSEAHSWIDELKDGLYQSKGIRVAMLREDALHPIVSGNKWRKLKYNLKHAQAEDYKVLLTFGGAFSNHISAVAEAANCYGFKSIGVIRGERHDILNPTLQEAVRCGMELYYVDRESYRLKNSDAFLAELKAKFGDFYMIPEGGSNDLGVAGCEEILFDQTDEFDTIAVALGTGATMAGLVKSIEPHQQVMGFPALKNADFLKEEVLRFSQGKCQSQWELNLDYHFGGYAKVDQDLIEFMNAFYKQHNIPLDPVYTGKMMYGLDRLIKKGHFQEGTNILAVHTGGLQGIKGINQRYKNKGIQISYDETA